VRQADYQIRIKRYEDLQALEGRLPPGIIAVTGPPEITEPDRLTGLKNELLDRLHSLAVERRMLLLIEADGARQRPLKAPETYEPVIPGFAEIAVVVAGLSGLGRPLGPEWVHRPERFAALSGLEIGELITRQALVRVLAHPGGGLKGIPPAARRIALLNGVGSEELFKEAQWMAAALLGNYDAVLVGRGLESSGESSPPGRPFVLQTEPGPILSVYEPVAGIVLAAGGASRFGQPKQLLTLNGESLVHRSARIALEAGLSPVIVVIGAYDSEIRQAVADLPVGFVQNPDWSAGQSTSLQAGLSALPGRVCSAVFLLVDQPEIPVEVLQSLVRAHSRTLAPIAAPRVAGRRANPVLLDRVTFPSLHELRGDTGARPLFSDPDRFPVAWVEWDDPSLLLDVDTPQDYQRLIEEK
jgi:molybdenum cofactor cytidylyltransferase